MAAEGLLPFEAALARMLALGAPLPAETVALGEAGGRFLAADVAARLTQPPADVSAMDGYALRFADLARPLTLVGESAAGRPFGGRVGPGEAARIFTGAHVPAGADTVAVQEDAAVEGGVVRFPTGGPPQVGAHVRRAGQDVAAGAVVARAGERLSPQRIGLLAAAGHGAVPVHRRPRLALLATGDELVPPGAAPGLGQIASSNGVMLAALLGALAEVTDLGIVADSAEALAAAIARGVGHDLLVTIGGASVGNHDLVKPALAAAGAELDFWRIALQPGKPLMAGRLGAGVVVGLPGNPVSAFVCARLLLVPLLKRMGGDPAPEDRYATARTTVDLPANGPRRQFLRALAADGLVTPAAAQDSSLLSVLAGANALLMRPEQALPAPAGTAVSVLTL
jgi:molybdopterin molybdotransferase